MTGAIVQARLSSTRLPNKVLKKLGHKTVLEWVLDRLSECKRLDKVVVAVPDTDTELISFLARSDFPNDNIYAYFGHENDVLGRYYNAAKLYKIDRIVRVTSDCPCIDPDVVDSIVSMPGEYVANHRVWYENGEERIERTYPHGLDLQVFDRVLLTEAFYNATRDYDQEHVVPYMIRNNHPVTISALPKLTAPDIRVVLDAPEDYEVLKEMFEHLPENFRTIDIINYFKERKGNGQKDGQATGRSSN